MAKASLKPLTQACLLQLVLMIVSWLTNFHNEKLGKIIILVKFHVFLHRNAIFEYFTFMPKDFELSVLIGYKVINHYFDILNISRGKTILPL